jgi:hypothetical protein
MLKRVATSSLRSETGENKKVEKEKKKCYQDLYTRTLRSYSKLLHDTSVRRRSDSQHTIVV